MTKQSKKGYIYILFSKKNGTLYTGVTSDLTKRIYEHKNKLVDGFTKKYNVDKLGYYEIFDDITQAIQREKQIKAGSRKKKLDLIEALNPNWDDLYYKIIN
ncbi:MAG: GIY-YIG nuclease family protein [Candidatus Gastranaerophilales bacterium]|nr:GIY-YIG nuclease family protein [Candidatus Gastranaerophilales bacterium]MDD3593116.1 GIY-YIG nuclease family protein [Candidatus Gastranaerophilales bacterium]